MKEIQFTGNNVADVIDFLLGYNFIFVPNYDETWQIYGKDQYGRDYSKIVRDGDHIIVECYELPVVTVIPQRWFEEEVG